MSKDEKNNNYFMCAVEKNLDYYSGWGNGVFIKPNFPIFLTPELVSIVFHLCGDGYLGSKGKMANYRQVNKEGLRNFLLKLRNIFGYFNVTEKMMADFKVIIPKSIAEFYRFYFKLNSCKWAVARISDEIKCLDSDFLLAGLNAFIVDEGHIGDSIEIYSKNINLLEDINQIAQRLGYKCIGPKEKIARGKLDSYRMYISVTSSQKYFEDILSLTKKFPTCGLAHKQKKLEIIVKRRNRCWSKKDNGQTKKDILKLLCAKRTVNYLSAKLNIAPSSIREHLRDLEKKNLISRVEKEGASFLWEIIPDSPLVEQLV